MVLFTTNGSDWQHIGEWYKMEINLLNLFPKIQTIYLVQTLPLNRWHEFTIGRTLTYFNAQIQVGPDKKAVAWKYFGSADLTTADSELGSLDQIFQVLCCSLLWHMELPKLVCTSSGKQSAMLGFFPLDEEDAPESYGKAVHSIATVDGITVKEPTYLGHWVLIWMKIMLLIGPVMIKDSSDEESTNCFRMTSKEKPMSWSRWIVPKPGNYTITGSSYRRAPQANIYGWGDLINGTFDEDERSDLTTITPRWNGYLRFTKSKTYIDPSVNELGVRIRKNAKEIESPTGMAFSGEVED